MGRFEQIRLRKVRMRQSGGVSTHDVEVGAGGQTGFGMPLNLEDQTSLDRYPHAESRDIIQQSKIIELAY